MPSWENQKKMFGIMKDLATGDEIKKAKEYVLKRGLATILLIGEYQGPYGGMKNQMQWNMAMGTNNYPRSVDKTMKFLNTFALTSKNMFGKNLTTRLKYLKLLSLI